MTNKLIARPKYNRTSKKWNIYIKHEGKEIPLGKMLDDGIFFELNEYESKKDAIKIIKSVDIFELLEVKDGEIN